MIKGVFTGFKEFLARGNIVDLSVAVVIGTAFTALVTTFTKSILQPLIDRVGAGSESNFGFLRIPLGDGYSPIDLNLVVTAVINFVLVAGVVYFLVVAPYTRLRKRGEVEQAQDTQLTLLTEIRDLLAAQQATGAPDATDSTAPSSTPTGTGTGPSPGTARVTSADTP